MGFLAFPHVTAVNRFANLRWCSDDSQIYWRVTHLLVDVRQYKSRQLKEKINFTPKKRQKNCFLDVFEH